MPFSTPEVFKELLDSHQPPCISIYMPMQRAKPPAAENPRRLRNLIRRAEESALGRWKRREVEGLFDALRAVEQDPALLGWPADGLAVFASPGFLRTVRLQQPVGEMVDVADTFRVKPLIRAQQFSGRFQILCLTQRNVELYEGDRDMLEPVPLKGVPRTIVEALGDQLTEPHYTHSGHTGRGQNAPAVHGHHSKKDEDEIDLERFFRAVDRPVYENHSRVSGLPLILCAVTHYHDRFRRVSHNPMLVEEGIRLNPDSLSIDRLHEEAWKTLRPSYQKQLEKAIDEFGRARAYRKGSEDIRQVAKAAAESRIGTLLVDADKHVGGRLRPGGDVEFGDARDASFGDVLDDIAEQVVRTGGQVLVMPHDQMPTETGVAAIYRY